LIERIDRPLAGALTGRLQLDPCALRERFHPEIAEGVMRQPELGPCV
jgi:hypothetical protein